MLPKCRSFQERSPIVKRQIIKTDYLVIQAACCKYYISHHHDNTSVNNIRHHSAIIKEAVNTTLTTRGGERIASLHPSDLRGGLKGMIKSRVVLIDRLSMS